MVLMQAVFHGPFAAGSLSLTDTSAVAIEASLFAVLLLASVLAVRRQRRFRSAIFRQALLFVCEMAGLCLCWWVFDTPFSALPFPMPAAADVWLYLPAMTVYIDLGVLLHGLISMAAVGYVAFVRLFWELGIISQRRLGHGLTQLDIGMQWLFVLAPFTVISVVIMSWEAENWPLWFLVPVEFAFAWLSSRLLSSLVPAMLDRRVAVTATTDVDDALVARHQIERIQAFVAAVAAIAGLYVVLALHDFADPALLPIALLGLYTMFVSLDQCCAAFLALWQRSRPGDYRFFYPRRWLITVPLALGSAALGSEGAMPLLPTSSIGASLWLQAGAAAAAFLVFQPLTDAARYIAGVRKPAPDLQGQLNSFLQRFADDGSMHRMADRAKESRILDTRTAANAIGMTDPRRVQEVFRELSFPGRSVFFLGALGYLFLVHNANLAGTFNTNAVGIVVALITVLGGFLEVVNNPMLASTRNVFMLLLFLILVVAGVDAVLINQPALRASGPLVNAETLAGVPANLVGLVAGHAIVQELLLLLTFGSIVYMFRLMDVSLRRDERDARAEHKDVELVQLGHTQLTRARASLEPEKKVGYERAVETFASAIKLNPLNSEAWNGKGLALHEAGNCQGALNAYQEAAQLAPRAAVYVFNAAAALRELGHLHFENASQREAAPIAGSNTLAGFLILQAAQKERELGRPYYSQAAATYRRARWLIDEPDPEQPLALVARAQYYFSHRRLERDICSGLGFVLVELNEKSAAAEAISALERAIEISESNPAFAVSFAIYQNLGMAHMQLGHFAEAEAPRSPNAPRGDPAAQEAGREHFEKAARAFKRATSGRGRAAGAIWRLLGEAHLRSGKPAKALEALDHALKLARNDSMAWTLKIQALDALKQYDTAEQIYREAIAAGASSKQLEDTWTAVRRDSGDEHSA